jgi:HK97 family phage portal protein
VKSLVATARNAIVTTPIRYVSETLKSPQPPASSASANLNAYGHVGTLFAIVDRLATGCAQVDWKLWRTAKSGKEEDRVQVTRHAALDLLDSPTPFHSRTELIESVQQHIDLTGEGWLVLSRPAGKMTPPINMYFVRPDRMAPIPHPTKYLDGYVYFGPNNEKVFLELEEVIMLRRPNPLDQYRGMAPIQSVMTETQSYEYAMAWNRNFFLNDASPGGIIQVDKRLSDPDFEKMKDRWRMSHQGVGNAHRVAILEQATWQERAFNQRDMQFVELGAMSKASIREAYGFPKFALGDVDDVNRATAEASDVMLSRWLINPRLERWKGVLNRKLLPMFGATAEGLEFDFDDPTPPDLTAQMAELESRARVYTSLIGQGVDPTDASATSGLPVMTVTAPMPALPSAPPPFPGSAHAHTHRHRPRNQEDITPEEQARLHALETVQQDWRQILDRLMGQWRGISAQTREDIYAQIGAAVASGDPTALADLQLDEGVTAEGQALLAAAMVELAEIASQRVVDEAADQGVNIGPVTLSSDQINDWAKAIAMNLGKRLLLSAGREAIRRMTPNSTPQEVVQGVREHLEGLSDRDEQDNLGGALTNAQNSARIATLRAGPKAEYYADETLDENTCVYCEEVDGKWLGETLDEVERSYPNGGYVNCLGRERCRGTVIAIWRPETTN